MTARTGRLSALAVLALAVLTSACTTVAKTAPPTSTLPPLPPETVGFVTLIGSGSAVGSGSGVEAVDLTEGTSVGVRSLGVGTFPDAEAITPNGKTLYVASYASNTITPIDIAKGKVGKPIAVGNGPAGIAIAPNGKTAYVTDAGSSPIGNTVTPVDLKTGKALSPITVGAGPQGIAITPDGATAYVADAGAIVTGQSGGIGNTVTPIDLKTGQAGKPITVGNAPLAVAITPDGTTAYVTNSYSGSVSPITVGSASAGTPIEMTGSPQAIAISGGTAWVADDSSSVATGNNLTPISTSAQTAGTPVPVGKNPTAVAITPNGATAWVVCSGTNTVVPVDLSSAAVKRAGTVSVPGGVYAIALASEPHAEAQKTLGISSTPKTTGTTTKKG